MLRDFSIYGDSFVSWPLSHDFFIYENSSFGWFVQMVEVFCFPDSFVQKIAQQSDGSKKVTADSQVVCKVVNKLFFLILQISSKKTLWAKSTALSTTIPRYALFPLADIKFYCWVTSKSCNRYWTQCVPFMNTQTASIHSSSTDSVDILLSKLIKCLKMWKEQSASIKRNSGVERMFSIAKKKLSRKKYRKHLLSSFQKTKSTQTNGSVVAEKFD